MNIRTVLCPLDFSDLSYRSLEMATDLCRVFGARLVVHHNLATAGPGAAMSWMWMQEQKGQTGEAAVELRLRQALERLPAELEPRAILTRGLAAPAIITVQQQVNADLLLLGTHGATSEDHTSVTDNVIAESRCPVLVLHESELSHPSPPPTDAAARRSVLVPTDFSRQSRDSLNFALELSAMWPMRLHLLHVVQGPPLVGHQPGEDALYMSLRALVPAERRGTTRYHVRFGDPSTEIATTARALDAQAIVMGAHARGLLRRFLTRDTSLGVVHSTDCPIWVVPTSRAA